MGYGVFSQSFARWRLLMLCFCPECGKKKSSKRFYKSASTRDGASSYCKVCTRLRTGYYRKKNPIRNARYEHAWRKKNPLKYMLSQTRRSARKRGWKFNIDLAHLQTVFVKNCPILGVRLNYGGTGRHAKPNSASIDRINSKRGYVLGNVAIISYRANLIKNDGTADEHRKIARYMASFLGAHCGDGQ